MLINYLRLLLLICCFILPNLPAWSIAVDPPLEDPVLESRAHAIHKQLRCLVCQNQSIEDSNSALARDLRVLVRERILAGDSDNAAIDFVVDRYGDWVLLKPPLKSATILLWIGPAVFIVFGVIIIGFWYRRRAARVSTKIPELTDDERANVNNLLDDGDNK